MTKSVHIAIAALIALRVMAIMTAIEAPTGSTLRFANATTTVRQEGTR